LIDWIALQNAYQYPTVWEGAHVLSGGEKTWAAEDAAEHALNLANWRIKLLKAHKEQRRIQGELMKVGNPPETKSSSVDAGKLKEVEDSVLALAKETRKAISTIQAEVNSKCGGDCGKAKEVKVAAKKTTTTAKPAAKTSKKSLSRIDRKLGVILNEMKDINVDGDDEN
jgi:hypothetical protein